MEPVRSTPFAGHTPTPPPSAAPAAAPLPAPAGMPASAAPLNPARVTPPPASAAAAAAAAVLAAAPAADAKAVSNSIIDCVNRFGAMILHSMHTKAPKGSHIFFPPGALKALFMLLRGTSNLKSSSPALQRLADREDDAKFDAAQALKDLSREITHVERQVACKGPNPPIVTFGTAVCTNGNVPTSFSDILRAEFDSEIIPDANAARVWVAKQITNETFRASFMKLLEPLFKDIANPETFSTLQLLYIHLILQDDFKVGLGGTEPKPFFCSDGTMKVVQVMQQTRHLPVFDGPDFTVVKLRFSSAKQSCFVFIPKDPSHIGSLLERIPELLKTVPQQMQSKQEICFEMPKISMDGIIDLLEIFVENGLIDKKTVYDLIDARARLRDLKQAVKWLFNEKETIAAGGTLATSALCPKSEPRLISATTPFILCIASNEAIPLCLLQATLGDSKFFDNSNKDVRLKPQDLTQMQGEFLDPEAWQQIFDEMGQYTQDAVPKTVLRYTPEKVVLTAVNCTDHRFEFFSDQLYFLIDGKFLTNVDGHRFFFTKESCDFVIWKKGKMVYLTDKNVNNRRLVGEDEGLIGTLEIDLETGRAKNLKKRDLDQLKATRVVAHAEADVKMGAATIDPMKHLAPLLMKRLPSLRFADTRAYLDAGWDVDQATDILLQNQFDKLEELKGHLKAINIEIAETDLKSLQNDAIVFKETIFTQLLSRVHEYRQAYSKVDITSLK